MAGDLVTDVAALFVDPRGPYPERVVHWYDEARDARTYAGPYPVVAHPPCARWCRLAGFCEARWGHKRGDDGGLFAFALDAVRRWGGVLEHPAYSDAWAAFGLNRPPTGGGWVNADMEGGWTCYVEQGRYGHQAKKATWLYAHGVELPSLRWGHVLDTAQQYSVRWHTGNPDAARKLLTQRERITTPDAMVDELIGMAQTVERRRAALQSKHQRSRNPDAMADVLIGRTRSAVGRGGDDG